MTKEETKEAIKVMQAYIDDKKIEYYNGQSTQNPHWSWDNNVDEYRVKSEPKLRPYKDAKEFLEAQQKHGLYLERFGNFYVPSLITEEGVSTSGTCFCPWDSILKYYKWQDGTPCGIMEK